MVKHLLSAWACLMVLTAFSSLYAAGPKIKFGQVDLKDLQMTVYDMDSNAAAVVLYDHGYSYLQYERDHFKLIFEHHKRIKILNKAGYEYATDQIEIYHSNQGREKVQNLKGFTYNLENGAIVKTKLNAESVFDEKISDHVDAKKFTMPNVKEGSVIEFSYTVSSDFISNLRDWEFQSAIPTVWSEYNVKYYDYFYYKPMFQGYVQLHDEYNTRGENIIIMVEAKIDAGLNGGRRPGYTETVNSKVHMYKWTAENVPALKEEPFITTMDDYVTKVFFDLSSVKFPGAMSQEYSQNWESINKNLLESESFGKQLNKAGFLKNELAFISAANEDPVKKMASVLELVKSKMKWNKTNRIYCTSTIKKAWEEKTGSSADINLLLVAMLREAGLMADPVILSTRNNGRVMSAFAHLSRFNYVVAKVDIGDGYYLLDATDPYNVPNMLPIRCINGEGRVISSTQPGWVPLSSGNKLIQLFNMQVKISPEGMLSGQVNTSSSGYAAYQKRKEILQDGQEKYISELKSKTHNWEYDKFDIKNLEKLGEVLNINYEANHQEPVAVGGMIYLTPMLFDRETENPFKLEDRQFPVDFAVPIDKTCIYNFVLPEGYQVEDLPKSTIVSLPDNAGRFSYNLVSNGNTIQLVSKLQLRKPIFYAEEYGALKEFYGLVVAKQAEQIVLKKVK